MKIEKSAALVRHEKAQEIKGKGSKNTADVVDMLEMVLVNQLEIIRMLKKLGGDHQ